MRVINSIVVHCSDSDRSAHNDIAVIRKWHTSPDPNDPSKPWSDVAYHLFIQRSGSAQLGRPIERPGAHARGHNTYSLGICVHGRKNFTGAQKKALVAWLKHYLQIFDLSPSDIYGHYELDAHGKTCPNMDMGEIRAQLI